jgi:glycosyltransferase involved in cell wall biosynthesis
LKVIEITPAYKPAYIYGGPTMSVSKLCEALLKAFLSLEVFTTTANGKAELMVSPNKQVLVDGVKVTYFTRLTKDHTHFSPNLMLALVKEIKKTRKSNDPALVVHIHAWWNLVSIFSCYVAKYYRVPVILSPRGMINLYTYNNKNSNIKSILHDLIGKKLLRYCHIHATSEKEKEDILNIITPKSITVIPNLVNIPKISIINDIRADMSINTDSAEELFSCIFLSRIEEKKGLELLLEALERVKINWKLTIAGTGERAYIQSLKLKINGLGLTDKIDWIGHVHDKDKFKLIARHHLMVLTSYNENFANVVIESLSVGTPVLISEQVGLAQYVKDKKMGWITNLKIEKIKETLETAYSEADRRFKIRKLAPDIIFRDFNSEVLIDKYTELFQKVKSNYN